MVAASRHTPPPNEKEHHMTAQQIVIELFKTFYGVASGTIDEVYVVRICTRK